MRIRLRFTKTGPIRFVGHLDFMRTFQKAVKKSGLMAVYSAGFNPHMLISFAAPLGVGEETMGDYADIEFAYRDHETLTEHEAYRIKDIGLENDELPDPPCSEEMVRQLAAAMPPGVTVTSAVRVGLTKDSKAMALVRYASWQLSFGNGFLAELSDAELSAKLKDFLSQEEIVIHKKTKKSEKDVNIRPLIRSMNLDLNELGERILLITCASGSTENLKPLTALQAFTDYAGSPGAEEESTAPVFVCRMELYDENLRPLEALGTLF